MYDAGEGKVWGFSQESFSASAELLAKSRSQKVPLCFWVHLQGHKESKLNASIIASSGSCKWKCKEPARQMTSGDDITIAFEGALLSFSLFDNLMCVMVKQYVFNMGLKSVFKKNHACPQCL